MRTLIQSNPKAPPTYAENTVSLAVSLRAAIGKGWLPPHAENDALRLYHALNAFIETAGGSDDKLR